MSRVRIARAAGVSRATVKHYNDLGLLPAPVFTGPNMAYYDPDCVQRIRLIRALRSQRHLPLREIGEMLGKQGAERVAQALHLSRALQADLVDALAGERRSAVGRDELLSIRGMDERVLSELERLRLVRALPGARQRRYDALSLKLVEAVGVMRAAGLTEEAGFEVSDLSLYVDRLAELVRDEVRLFSSRVLGRFDGPTEERYMRSALKGADALVLAVRDRLLADLLEGEAPRGGRSHRRRPSAGGRRRSARAPSGRA